MVQSLDISVFVASIDTENYKNMYYGQTNDIYDIALQTILENFVHFLLVNKGVNWIVHKANHPHHHQQEPAAR